ncbi:MAG: hypothetical protein JKY43_11900 [Phycisphaerales bacterium]|nr:hypothetical protein [Phycisphaerales bacterium]
MSEQFTNSIGPLTPNEITLDAELEVLGYTIEWIHWGILTVDEFQEQLKDFLEAIQARSIDEDSEADDNPEHYRYKSLIKWLSFHSNISDLELYQLIWLDRHDMRYSQEGGICHSLIRGAYADLTDSQFEYVSKILSANGNSQVVEEMAAIRKCWSTPWSEDIRELLLSAVCGRYQVQAIDGFLEDMTRDDLIAFSERGASKAARNLAKERLNSRRFR